MASWFVTENIIGYDGLFRAKAAAGYESANETFSGNTAVFSTDTGFHQALLRLRAEQTK